MAEKSTVAVILNREGQDCQSLLASLTEGWLAAGVKVAGVLAQDNEGEGVCSAGFLRDIGSGVRYSVHLDAPPPGKTCHLDAAGMSEACTGLLGQIDTAEIVVLSKFGKLEALRRGLWTAFDAAASAGKPLLTTVSPKHLEAFGAFCPEAARLDADGASIRHWWQATAPAARLHPSP